MVDESAESGRRAVEHLQLRGGSRPAGAAGANQYCLGATHSGARKPEQPDGASQRHRLPVDIHTQSDAAGGRPERDNDDHRNVLTRSPVTNSDAAQRCVRPSRHLAIRGRFGFGPVQRLQHSGQDAERAGTGGRQLRPTAVPDGSEPAASSERIKLSAGTARAGRGGRQQPLVLAGEFRRRLRDGDVRPIHWSLAPVGASSDPECGRPGIEHSSVCRESASVAMQRLGRPVLPVRLAANHRACLSIRKIRIDTGVDGSLWRGPIGIQRHGQHDELGVHRLRARFVQGRDRHRGKLENCSRQSGWPTGIHVNVRLHAPRADHHRSPVVLIGGVTHAAGTDHRSGNGISERPERESDPAREFRTVVGDTLGISDHQRHSDFDPDQSDVVGGRVVRRDNHQSRRTDRSEPVDQSDRPVVSSECVEPFPVHARGV